MEGGTLAQTIAELLVFWGARLDDVGRIALAAMEAEGDDGVWEVRHEGCDGGCPQPCPYAGQCHIRAEEGFCRHMVVEGRGIIIYDEGGHDEDQAEHIALNDPAAALRSVAADRAILEALKAALAKCPVVQRSPADYWQAGLVFGLVAVAGQRVAVFSGHPDYQAEWGP